MKNTVRQVVVFLFQLLPYRLGRILFRLWLQGVANQAPKTAMYQLLELDADLTEQIEYSAIDYDNGIHAKHRLTKYHDFFIDRLAPGERVLDIGCGIGAVAYAMAAKADALVTGIDLDAKNIAKANQLQHPKLRFIQGDVLEELPQEPVETIVLSNVLEHIEHRVRFLKMVQEKLKPRRWLIRVPMCDRHWTVPMRQELGLFYFSDPTHYTEYTQQSFEAEMQAADFAIAHLQINWGEIWAEVHSQT